ncbi:MULTISPECIES: serine O-acetyltransferase EpsC [Chryseobacterium]|uniref:Serine acetyltransferase n=1 Tax=Chryseobacterium cucumeris TaxID=1813611 RepID=A0ABX9X0A1_9FLAO|nr:MULTISPECIES: serine O-acetyltransferase EpsC [Chryseobacterium]KYH07198.1 serine acetyltransferase [Chryseobacterium cucumeris]MDH5033208.1 serine O-acetyltransferase [Chryseobacterium cucumeris]QWT86817.1 serine acetyltransferase [Chryseobacterium sp. PCH239]ROH87469.1 serine acetyltransferase [Chryseobacterium cucumeris]
MAISDQLTERIHQTKQNSIHGFFDKIKTKKWVKDLYETLFLPQHDNTEDELKRNFEALQETLSELINTVTGDKTLTEKQVNRFFEALPEIYDQLVLDAKSILEFDPAADSLEEVYLAYPGFFATYVYRISHQLWSQEVKILPRVISEYAHSKTGIDIHPGATIGKSFFIDHGTGIVIGETTVIGNNVKIYQGVTLGALNVSKEKAHQKRHPNIEDDVIIYSGATILGGETTIGRESIIGGNVWVTQDVPANSLVYHKSEIKIKDNSSLPESLTFVI